MCCLDCFKKLTHSHFYNFNHPLNEIVIMNNKNIHTQQPIFEKNTYLYNKYNNLIPPYKVHNDSQTIPKSFIIPKIIINDTDEEIIYDKVSGVISRLEDKTNLRGEIIIVISGHKENIITEIDLEKLIRKHQNMSTKDLSTFLSDKTGLPKKIIYNKILDSRDK